MIESKILADIIAAVWEKCLYTYPIAKEQAQLKFKSRLIQAVDKGADLFDSIPIKAQCETMLKEYDSADKRYYDEEAKIIQGRKLEIDGIEAEFQEAYQNLISNRPEFRIHGITGRSDYYPHSNFRGFISILTSMLNDVDERSNIAEISFAVPQGSQVISFSMDSQVRVNIWSADYPRTLKTGESHVGHVSLQTFVGGRQGNGIYASFWPDFAEHNSMRARISSVFPAGCKSRLKTYDEDLKDEGRNPDVVYHLYGLSVNAINNKFIQFLDSNFNWSLLGIFLEKSYNCAGLVEMLLNIGGIYASLRKVRCETLNDNLVGDSITGVVRGFFKSAEVIAGSKTYDNNTAGESKLSIGEVTTLVGCTSAYIAHEVVGNISQRLIPTPDYIKKVCKEKYEQQRNFLKKEIDRFYLGFKNRMLIIKKKRDQEVNGLRQNREIEITKAKKIRKITEDSICSQILDAIIREFPEFSNLLTTELLAALGSICDSNVLRRFGAREKLIECYVNILMKTKYGGSSYAFSDDCFLLSISITKISLNNREIERELAEKLNRKRSLSVSDFFDESGQKKFLKQKQRRCPGKVVL